MKVLSKSKIFQYFSQFCIVIIIVILLFKFPHLSAAVKLELQSLWVCIIVLFVLLFAVFGSGKYQFIRLTKHYLND